MKQKQKEIEYNETMKSPQICFSPKTQMVVNYFSVDKSLIKKTSYKKICQEFKNGLVKVPVG